LTASQDLARIRAFVQVHESGGFSAASRLHGRSKALLSKYVTDLEDHLGVRLMNRTTRKLSLTEAGTSYYREVIEILGRLDALDDAMADHTADARGLVRVSAPRNFGETVLSAALFSFLQQNPNVSLDLRLEDRFADLVDEGIDLAVRITAMPDSSLIARKIADSPMRIVASPALLARVGTPNHPEQLRNLPCIIDTNLQGQANWRFEEAGRALSVAVDGPVRVNSPIAALRAAEAGLGFAAVPLYIAANSVAARALISVLDPFVPVLSSLQVVYPHRRHLAGKVRALVDFLIGWFDEHPLA
jgi:DNA-binding transcriptional LysR family regulator